ncbi:MAG: CbiQ family ECF transporter T component [Spirochaetia bacterium]
MEDIFYYRWGSSPVHRLAPGVKLGTLVLISLAVFFSNLPLLVLPGSAIFTGYLLSRRSPFIPLFRAKGLLLIILSVILIFAIQGDMIRGAEFSLKLTLLFLLGNLFSVTTTAGEAGSSVYALLRPISPRFASCAAVSIRLTILTIPDMVSAMRDAGAAVRIRTGGRKRIKNAGILGRTVITMTAQENSERADALAVRGWYPGAESGKAGKMTVLDGAVLISAAAWLLFIILLRVLT